MWSTANQIVILAAAIKSSLKAWLGQKCFLAVNESGGYNRVRSSLGWCSNFPAKIYKIATTSRFAGQEILIKFCFSEWKLLKRKLIEPLNAEDEIGIHCDFRLCEILQLDKLGQNMDIMWIEFYQKKIWTNKILLSSSIFH